MKFQSSIFFFSFRVLDLFVVCSSFGNTKKQNCNTTINKIYVSTVAISLIEIIEVSTAICEYVRRN